MGALWLYTILRFGLAAALWGILLLLGVGWFLAAVIALALSLPLSYVLLKKPRALLSETIEQRVASARSRRADLDDQLDAGATAEREADE
jgi:membrane protein implicated in regulation of membrane protease activity